MAESSKEELLQLIKRFGAHFTVKMSNLFSVVFYNLDSRTAVAIAGLAVAVIFTWRLLQSPNAVQGRQPKRRGTQASSSSVNSLADTTLTSPGVSSSSEDSRAQNVVDDFFQPVKPTLGQIVRQKLCEGRKVTCRLVGVILEESSPEELQKQATVRSSVLEVLLEITKYCDLYLMERILDDESEKRVLLALEDAGIFTSGGLIKDKVLFCSTEKGRMSFVRQLEPDWHIDTNPEIISQLAINVSISLLFIHSHHFLVSFSFSSLRLSVGRRGSSNTSFTFLLADPLTPMLLVYSPPHPWKNSLDAFDVVARRFWPFVSCFHGEFNCTGLSWRYSPFKFVR